MSITESLIEIATRCIETTGYTGVFLLMTLESMVAPVPSEAVMPFAGFLVHEGKMSWLGVMAASSAGSIAGSLLSYWMGAWGGRALVLRFGRYLLLNEHHLVQTEQFFARRGPLAVLLSRFIPVVRHLISIPAGMGRMHLGWFILYTFVGATLWNGFLAWVGYALGNNWELVQVYGHWFDLALLALLLCAGLYYGVRWQRRRNARRGGSAAARPEDAAH